MNKSTHTVEVKFEEKTFVTESGEVRPYLDAYITVDGFMQIKLERSQNKKNLQFLYNNGDVFNVLPAEIQK